MSEQEKNERMVRMSRFIAELSDKRDTVSSGLIRKSLDHLIRQMQDLRDTMLLFDSGEKELIRLHERYLPYLFEILEQYVRLEESANYEAIVRNESQLADTLKKMSETVRSVREILPLDEIEEANARAKAEQLKELLVTQCRSMLK